MPASFPSPANRGRAAKPTNCAMEWQDLDAFKDLFVERLTSS